MLRGLGNFDLCNRIYLRNEKVRKTVLACSYGAQVESLYKIGIENLVTLSITIPTVLDITTKEQMT